ncbi:MAG: ATP-binding cassette domain-containing protein, partial [Ruminococcus sp.]
MIDLINLTKKFDKNIAVNNITASIPEGAICGLAGSNGSGKSTLLRMLSGVYEPDGGTVLIDGKRNFENMEIRGNCYYISDYPF